MTRPGPVTINLALQGGGAHGAFTAGVLDRLLEEERIGFEGVTGTSAGAVNGLLLADGLRRGGRPQARATLSHFWDQVSSLSLFDHGGWNLINQGFMGFKPATMATRAMLELFRYTSPYQFNPFDLNPLREVLSGLVDFQGLRESGGLKLFVAATQVLTGKIRIFRNAELTPEVILASACLPHLHHAITIDGEHYWDGAFSGNPPIYPLILDCRSADMLVVMLHPLRHSNVPTSGRGISERLIELSTNATFLREMESIALGRRHARARLFALGRMERRLKRLRFHLIEADELMSSLDHPSKYNTDSAFISMLRQAGREHAEQWLAGSREHVGVRSSVDIDEMFT